MSDLSEKAWLSYKSLLMFIMILLERFSVGLKESPETNETL